MNKEIAFMMKLLEVMHLLQEKKKDTLYWLVEVAVLSAR